MTFVHYSISCSSQPLHREWSQVGDVDVDLAFQAQLKLYRVSLSS